MDRNIGVTDIGFGPEDVQRILLYINTMPTLSDDHKIVCVAELNLINYNMPPVGKLIV